MERRLWIALVGPLLLIGCSRDSSDPEPPPDPPATAPVSVDETGPKQASEPTETMEEEGGDPAVTDEGLHEALRQKNSGYNGQAVFERATADGPPVAVGLTGSGVTDISPLAGLELRILDASGEKISDLSPLEGMPIERLGLERTEVTDLSPLQGMPLFELWLNNTAVKDLSPLQGMPLVKLSLYSTRVKDIEPLAGMPLQELWLNNTDVSSIEPLKGAPLESLTIQGTKVDNIGVVQFLPRLQRLHLAETPVSDLTPLKFTNLTRLVFTPARVERGLEDVRQLFTLREIGTVFDANQSNLMPPSRFWALYDEGKIP